MKWLNKYGTYTNVRGEGGGLISTSNTSLIWLLRPFFPLEIKYVYIYPNKTHTHFLGPVRRSPINSAPFKTTGFQLNKAPYSHHHCILPVKFFRCPNDFHMQTLRDSADRESHRRERNAVQGVAQF